MIWLYHSIGSKHDRHTNSPPGSAARASCKPSCVFGFHHFVTTDLSHVARWSQHHGPFSCRCTSLANGFSAPICAPLVTWLRNGKRPKRPRKWMFFFSNDDNFFCFLGAKVCLFSGGKQALWFQGGCQSETICQKGELMCHQTERRTVLFVMNQNRVGCELQYMDVSENNGTPKSSILIGFSIINHPIWGTPIFGNTHMGKTNILHPLSKTSQLRLTWKPPCMLMLHLFFGTKKAWISTLENQPSGMEVGWKLGDVFFVAQPLHCPETNSKFCTLKWMLGRSVSFCDGATWQVLLLLVSGSVILWGASMCQLFFCKKIKKKYG